MKGYAKPLYELIEGNKIQFVIPVYQRNYDWRTENCDQLLADLVRLSQSGRPSHFFGSIVTASADGGHSSLVIDGQQRLTTISLLLMAGIKAVRDNAMAISDEARLDEAYDTFLKAKYCYSERKIKLVPVEGDMAAYDKIYNGEEQLDEGANVTRNFRHLYEALTSEPRRLTFDQLLEAIERLQVISIELDPDDDAQLIFESLNSTGLALTEADKVRNYMLMALSREEQQEFFKGYWQKIDAATGGDPTKLLRDYLTIKQQLPRHIRLASIYFEWKKYMEGRDRKSELSEMLDYASLYRQVTDADLPSPKLSEKMRHICNIETDVCNVFLIQFLKYAIATSMPEEEELKVMDLTENYLARRIVCNLPGNALTQVFCALHKDVVGSLEERNAAGDAQSVAYHDVMAYHLLRRDGNYQLPRDRQFVEAIRTRDAYHMPKPFQIFLFERLENSVPGESNDVATEMRTKKATIEHIMPQTLNDDWKTMLGESYEEIQEKYLHTFANLTLTGINSELSNKSFAVKRDGKSTGGEVRPGYKDSKYRMTRSVTAHDKWTEAELENRGAEIAETLLRLYPLPTTEFEPKPKPVEEVSLADESFVPTHKRLRGFRLFGHENQETAWSGMLMCVVKIVLGQKADKGDSLFGGGPYFFSEKQANPKYCTQIGPDKYVWTMLDNKSKLQSLRFLFDRCGIAQSELTLLLEPENDNSGDEAMESEDCQ